MTLSEQKPKKVASGLVLLLFLAAAGCKESHFILPGELVLSRPGWDHVAYFDGLHYREVRIQPNATTSFVSFAREGPGGATYAISYEGQADRNPPSNGIVAVGPDGAMRMVFRSMGSAILSFAPTPTALVLLMKPKDQCPSVVWASYDGNFLKALPAPCESTFVDASTPDKTILGTEKGVLLQHGDEFVPTNFGSAAVWINPDELMYWDPGPQCTWRYTLSHDTRTKVICGYLFDFAASPDGRYIAVRVLTAEYFSHDVPELRILDTQTGRYISVNRGAPPTVFWSDLRHFGGS